MEGTAMSTSVSTVRGLHYDIAERVLERADPKLSSSSTTDNIFQSTPSNTGSMTSVLILPSPPDSPSLSPVHSVQHSPSFDSLSESSLPSVSSSFFFSSSAAGSPGRSRNGSYPQSEQGQDKEHSVQDIGALALIIPSLTLPPALRQPTPFGQTLGSLRLLVLGAQGAGKSFLTGLLLEDNEDVVEVGTWEDWEEFDGSFGFGKVLKASTDWLDRRDSYGSERYEPTRNVHIVELPGYSQDANATELITRLKGIIEVPFHALHNVLHPDTPPSGTLSSLLASPTSPFYTAMVFLLPSTPTPLDLRIVSDLSSYIPLIVLPRLHGPHRDSAISQTVIPSTLSTFQPSSAIALRSGLFRSPETVALLRGEAADRFLRWREVERSVERILDGKEEGGTLRPKKRRLNLREYMKPNAGRENEVPAFSEEKWDRTKWEAKWLGDFSRDVDSARRKREAPVVVKLIRQATEANKNLFTSSAESTEKGQTLVEHPEAQSPDGSAAMFDPLHFSSLLAFSVSLLRIRLVQSVHEVWGALNKTQVKAALLGGFCIGFSVGIGLFDQR